MTAPVDGGLLQTNVLLLLTLTCHSFRISKECVCGVGGVTYSVELKPPSAQTPLSGHGFSLLQSQEWTLGRGQES